MAASMSMNFLWFTAVFVLSVLPSTAKQKPVSVTLNAKWGSTPILLEASEYIASENKENFWQFIDDVSKLNPQQFETETDQSYYHLVMKYAAKVLTPLQQRLMKFSLSLRAFSPAIQNYQQMAAEESPPPECVAFVNVHGEKTCDPTVLDKLLESAKNRPKPPVYQFDHIYPGSNGKDKVVILYAELGMPLFTEFHDALKALAADGSITYVLRYFIQNPSVEKTRLSGYGVELAIKSTEYKAKDDTKIEGEDKSTEEDDDQLEDEVQGFIFSTLKELYPDQKSDLKKLRSYLSESSTELAALKVWELQDLSFQAAQKILNAPKEEQIKMLTDISQNFPSVTRSLVKTAVKSEMKKEISKNQKYFENNHGLSAGESAMYLNGLSVDMEVYDIYTLLDLMRSEANLMEGLFSLGFKDDMLNKLLRLDLGGDSKDFALDIRHTAIQFLNDLENDKKYKNWPTSVQDILRPTFPGMLRHVAKNFFHLVFFVDPTDSNSMELVKMAEAFLVHSAPIRLSVVFIVNFDSKADPSKDVGVAISRAYDFIRQEYNFPKALSFVTDVYEKVKSEDLTAKLVIKEFKKGFPDEESGVIFGENDEYDVLRKAAADYISKSGLSDFPQVLLNGVPMKKKFLTGDSFEEGVVGEIMSQTTSIQKAVYNGHLHDYVNILEWLMEKDHVLPRLNSRVLSPPSKTLDFIEEVDKEADEDKLEEMNSRQLTTLLVGSSKYLSRKDEESLRPVTMLVVSDLETAKGRDLLYSVLKRLKHSYELRVSIIFNHNSVLDSDLMISKAVYAALNTLSNNHAKSFITKLVKEENVADLKSGTKTLRDLEVHGMDMNAYLEAYEKQSTSFLDLYGTFIQKVLGWSQSDLGIIANGKVIGPLDSNEEFQVEDTDLLEKVVYQSGAKKVKEQMMMMGFAGDVGSDLIMKVSALLSSASSQSSRKEVQYGGDQHSVIKIPADSKSPAYQIEVIVDPVSQDAQKIGPILNVMSKVANLDIKVFMNCREKISEMPVKNYYRYVLEPDLSFRPDGSLTAGPSAKFLDLPQKSILTLGVNAPESWLVESVKAPYDLDNLLLEEVEGSVNAEFDLEYILLEGHCSDIMSGQPPRGLQFTLGTNSSKAVVDTIVMANLGYFQLKASPGVWTLNLREGRSLEIYKISSHELTDTPADSKDIQVSINNFKSKIIQVKVEKHKDKLAENLLKDEDDDKSLWDSISSSFTRDKGSEDDNDNTLNIFSLASGHMYERLMRIMMLSVLKHTKSKVKFWFLKNYLSPSFKDFIPLMAKEYEFEYELVQYKWPRWLNQQTEKQRIMWGYKILFLDVLFPLDVKKFIFVDADQVVRTDLKELHDFDLEGAPYGYTPFCESRKEMDGFRFWKSGYWASHLAGRKYHISALYVVDLKKFRRIAAGDRLRGQYQGLSQDPNSLSNLDQDLPNNMIHQVAMKSLPQEWLWCETWCDDKSKTKAKTIDLCNNPQTKEPKLKAALRILPEWKEYDYEVKVLWDKVYRTNTRLQVEYEPPNIDESKIGSKLHQHDEL